jgi:hypothetical protein
MANVASVGMFGLSFIIWIANSFMDSRIAKNSVSVCSGLFSGKSLILAVRYGSSEVTDSSKRFFPCRITVVFHQAFLKRAKFWHGPNCMDDIVFVG